MPLTGGMEGFLMITPDESTSPYEFLCVRYGDTDTLLTTFRQSPPWEHFIPTVGINALNMSEVVLI